MHYESCGLISFKTFCASSSSSILSLFKNSRTLDLYLFLWGIEIYKQKKGTQWSSLASHLITIERLIQEAPLAWDQTACVLPNQTFVLSQPLGRGGWTKLWLNMITSIVWYHRLCSLWTLKYRIRYVCVSVYIYKFIYLYIYLFIHSFISDMHGRLCDKTPLNFCKSLWTTSRLHFRVRGVLLPRSGE